MVVVCCLLLGIFVVVADSVVVGVCYLLVVVVLVIHLCGTYKIGIPLFRGGPCVPACPAFGRQAPPWCRRRQVGENCISLRNQPTLEG